MGATAEGSRVNKRVLAVLVCTLVALEQAVALLVAGLVPTVARRQRG